MVRNLPASAGDAQKRHGFGPWVGKISWSRKWQPSPVFLPGKFHGQWSLVGYSSGGHKESDMTEHKKEWGQVGGPLLNCVCFFSTIALGFSVQYFFFLKRISLCECSEKFQPA